MMAYLASTFSTMHDLLDKIRSFLLANGWIVNLWTDDNTEIMTHATFDYTNGKRLHVQKTASDGTVMYFNLRSVTKGVMFTNYSNVTSTVNGRLYNEQRGIGINGSTGYDVGLGWGVQPGAPTTSNGKSVGGVITEVPSSGTNNYFAFQNGDTVTIIAEIDTETYMFMTFGCLQKSGTWVGGQFYSCSCSNYDTSFAYWYISGGYYRTYRTMFLAYDMSCNGSGAVYVTQDSVGAWRFIGYPGDSIGAAYSAKVNPGGQGPYCILTDLDSLHMSAFAYTRCPNDFNGLAVMIPLYMFNMNASGRWSYLGTPDSIRAISLSNYSPAAEFTIEADTWKVFPAHTKVDASASNLNGNVGFAFKK